MPYIPTEIRKKIDTAINTLVTDINLAERNVYKRKGVVNYTACKIALNCMEPIDGWGYSSLSETVAALRDAANEIERRLLANYENHAISKNGDLVEFSEHINWDERGHLKWIGEPIK